MPEEKFGIGQLGKRTGITQAIIRQHLDGRIPFTQEKRTTTGQRTKNYYTEESIEGLILCRALWDMGFEKEEQLIIVRKIYTERTISLQQIKEKMQKFTFLELIDFFEKNDVVLLERNMLKNFLGK